MPQIDFPYGRSIGIFCGDLCLRPLVQDDREDLRAIALDPQIWARSTTSILSDSDLDWYIKEAVELYQSTERSTFAVTHPDLGIVGATALGNYSAVDKRIEIGWTWLGVNYQGTGINTLVKAALLQFCFDEGIVERVEFKTDVLNKRARAALRKIGATEEGVLRSHTLMPGGRRRNTIYYSILRSEWKDIRGGALDSCPDIIIKERL